MTAPYRCQVCNAALTINKSAGRTRVYCSNRCAIEGVGTPISRFQEEPATPVRVCHETREKH
jgi:hypothetical protein